jgi:hypothetical protein
LQDTLLNPIESLSKDATAVTEAHPTADSNATATATAEQQLHDTYSACDQLQHHSSTVLHHQALLGQSSSSLLQHNSSMKSGNCTATASSTLSIQSQHQ